MAKKKRLPEPKPDGRQWCVVEEDRVGYENGYSVGAIFGPFDSQDRADRIAERLRAKDSYGVSFSVKSFDDHNKSYHWE